MLLCGAALCAEKAVISDVLCIVVIVFVIIIIVITMTHGLWRGAGSGGESGFIGGSSSGNKSGFEWKMHGYHVITIKAVGIEIVSVKKDYGWSFRRPVRRSSTTTNHSDPTSIRTADWYRYQHFITDK
ncbi:unnamed protein product [Gongylonema pulchrum]|uniref:Secreted protein n=1 Tax=Gongylonema pulchrum TaxID=637853 RepID=A0A183DAU4_9BILA|nr:unnamed protein product [Gongylonema pulchrum]